MRKSKGMKNVFWGLISQAVTIGLGILIPRLILVNLGSEANGLLSSIGSIVSYLALLEAGVGTATLQALYKPFGKNDKAAINRIMAATDYFYRRTGYIYLCLVVVVSIGYTLFVNTTIPKVYVFGTVLLAGVSGVISYFFQGKYRLLLAAEGKGYVITNISTFSTVGVSLTKVLFLLAGTNVVCIQSIYFVFNLLQMIIIICYIKKYYPWIDLNVEPNFEAISQRKAVLIHQITELIFNNTDVIILTFFTSLQTVSVYSMYAMIFGMVKSVTVTLSDSYLYVLGQSYHDRKRFERLHNVYEVYNTGITFSLFCIAGILMIPFLKVYTRGIEDINYIDEKVLVLFILFYLMQNGRKSSQVVINIAQHFEKTKWRAITEALINLSVSIIFTAKYGIYGVLIGTVAALIYRTNDVIFYAARLMERSPLITYRRWMRNGILFSVLFLCSAQIHLKLESYLQLCLYGIVLSITIISLFVLVNSIFEPETSKYMFSTIQRSVLSKTKGRE